MRFYIGLHQPSDAKHFERACINKARLLSRASPIGSCRILLDSGAFQEVITHGRYRTSVAAYAKQIAGISKIARLDAAVAQDYMCESLALAKTGLAIEDHQRLTIRRYDALLRHRLSVPILPVLQGYAPREYARHVRDYGRRLRPGQWVGVGSLCKRNGRPRDVVDVLEAILSVRPDLMLHGFGLKITALESADVRKHLVSADSIAWSLNARRNGRNQNDWREADAWRLRVEALLN